MILQFFSELPSVICLYLKGNPCVRMISMYRKRMVNALPKLGYLDDRPIQEVERLMCEGWARGGKEEEERVRKEYADEKLRKEKENTRRNRETAEKGRQERMKLFEKMKAELKNSQKENLIEEHNKAKQEYENEQDDQKK